MTCRPIHCAVPLIIVFRTRPRCSWRCASAFPSEQVSTRALSPFTARSWPATTSISISSRRWRVVRCGANPASTRSRGRGSQARRHSEELSMMTAPRRLAALASATALLSMALAVSAARLDLNDDDDSDVLDELLAVDEEAERGGLDAADGGGAEAVRRAQSMVLVLNNDNARRAVEDSAELLLLGYAPWCERSAQLMPRFAEAAAALRAMGSSVAFAKLDGERYPKVAASVGVNGFPTVLLFVNGTEHTYTGLHTKDAIVTWVRKKTAAPVIRLQSRDSAEGFLKRDQPFVIGLFKNFEGAEYEEFVKAAITDDEVQFVETNDGTVAKILFPGITSEKPFLGLVKSEPEKFEKFDGEFEEKAILQFVELHKFPLITVFTELNSAKVYSSPIKMQVFIFSEAYDFEDLESMIEEIARAFKTKIMFIYVDTAEENLAKPFLTLYGLESDKRPVIVTAFDTTNGAKYLMEGDINSKNIREFCLGLLDGTLRPFQKSEPVPQEKGLVEKVVGRTFDSSVLESTQYVFLEVHTPWCVGCEAISKNVEKLAKHLSGLDNLKFARIDASVNEHPKLQVNDYPTLLLYPADDKSNPIKLSKKSSVKAMAKQIKEELQISDVETVAAADGPTAADNVKDEL